MISGLFIVQGTVGNRREREDQPGRYLVKMADSFVICQKMRMDCISAVLKNHKLIVKSGLNTGEIWFGRLGGSNSSDARRGFAAKNEKSCPGGQNLPFHVLRVRFVYGRCTSTFGISTLDLKVLFSEKIC